MTHPQRLHRCLRTAIIHAFMIAVQNKMTEIGESLP